MKWREWVLNFLEEERSEIGKRIQLFESGNCQVQQMRDGRMTDATGELLLRLNRNLAEIELIIAEANVRPDL